MNAEERRLRERHFVEELGIAYAEQGAPPMMGRILARLMICQPPEQTSAELADYLQASRGAISQTTRQLITARLIERAPMPGQRAIFFRLREHAFVETMRLTLTGATLVREIAERALTLLQDDPPEARSRVQECVDFNRFMEDRIPALFEEWLAERS